eukprot:TRINITY_DN40252_c0_g1_i1.p1 TRINITY_DN40252_c0_g1~~TRINITY_DN40252_c0_g1_i1.p1  ORF type:complete len:289 (+),score=90.81 TRINITY_DN40252_c0_g1_i1:97-867(+)
MRGGGSPCAAAPAAGAPQAALQEGEVRLLLTRHARQLPSSQRAGGDLKDPPLSEQGLQQAELLAARLAAELSADPAPPVVWSSPMRRALCTAIPVAKAFGVPLHCHGGLFEYSGAGTEHPGRPADAIEAELREHCAARCSHFGPGGRWDYQGGDTSEQAPQTRERAARVQRWLECELLPALVPGATAVVVAHQTFLDLLAQRLMEGTDEGWSYGGARYKFANTAMLGVAAAPSAAGIRYRLLASNDSQHLKQQAPS